MKHKNISVNRPSLRKIEVEFKKLKTALANCTEKPGIRTAQIKARMEYLQGYYKNITTPRNLIENIAPKPVLKTPDEEIAAGNAQIARLEEWKKTETNPEKLGLIDQAIAGHREIIKISEDLKKDSHYIGNAVENLKESYGWPGQIVVTTSDDTDAGIIPASARNEKPTSALHFPDDVCVDADGEFYGKVEGKFTEISPDETFLKCLPDFTPATATIIEGNL